MMVDISEELQEGKLLLNANQFLQAEQIFAECCVHSPEHADAWFSLGVSRHRQNKFDAALLAFNRAIHFDPDSLAAYNAKANMLVALGRGDEALEVIEQTLKLDPENAKTLTNYGMLLFRGGYSENALNAFDRALKQNPFIPDALRYRSVLRARLGRAEEALQDAVQLTKLIPDACAWRLQASALLILNRFDEALVMADKANALEAENMEGIVLAAMAQAALGRFEDAEHSFSLAESLDAGKLGELLAQQILNLPTAMQSNPLQLYLSLAEKRLQVCDWQNRTQYHQTLQCYLEHVDRVEASTADIMLLEAVCHTQIDPALRLELARHIALDAARRVLPFEHKFMTRPERLRIGYLARSLNSDSSTSNTAGIYALHNRSDFEVFCYSLEPGDGSEYNLRIKKSCDQYAELYPLSEFEIARKIQEDCIHILIDVDGVGLDYPYRLFAYQPAPIQITMGGSLFSSGASYIQYRVTDHIASPAEADGYWTEKLVRLPFSHFVYDQLQAISRSKYSRAEACLPKHGMVFGCFAAARLIEPEVFSCWMQILQRVPDSVLWLLEWNDDIHRNLLNEAYESGINPRRLIFAAKMSNQAEHLARLRLADLFLDTFIVNSNSTSDALWAGLPVLTLCGQTMATRMTASKLTAMELPTLICNSVQEYQERACYLATHPEYLGILRRKVQRHVLSKPLFNTQQTVIYLEAAYHEMWDRYFADAPLAGFSISEEV